MYATGNGGLLPLVEASWGLERHQSSGGSKISAAEGSIRDATLDWEAESALADPVRCMQRVMEASWGVVRGESLGGGKNSAAEGSIQAVTLDWGAGSTFSSLPQREATGSGALLPLVDALWRVEKSDQSSGSERISAGGRPV